MSKEAIFSILKNVNYPGFSRDIVSFGLVQQAEIDGHIAKVVLELSTADQTLPNTLKKEVEDALLADAAIKRAEVTIRVKNNSGANNGQTNQESENLSGVKRIIAVASGKGGVGKSTLSVNLACSLARSKKKNGEPLKIGLMDCDLYGPSVPLLIGASDRPELVGENLLTPVVSYGVKVISMGLLIDDDNPVVWRGPMIMKTIQQFAHNVVWEELDYLLIDLPPGTGDAQISLVQILPLDGALIVTTPQKAAFDIARKGARMFEKVNVPILGLIENMSYLISEGNDQRNYIFGKGGGAITSQALQCPFLGEIPLHEEVRLGGDHGTPAVVANPENVASKAIMEIAGKVVQIFE